MKIKYLGQGFMGLVFAACFMQAGYLLNDYITYHYAPVPLVTSKDLGSIVEQCSGNVVLDIVNCDEPGNAEVCN